MEWIKNLNERNIVEDEKNFELQLKSGMSRKLMQGIIYKISNQCNAGLIEWIIKIKEALTNDSVQRSMVKKLVNDFIGIGLYSYPV